MKVAEPRGSANVRQINLHAWDGGGRVTGRAILEPCVRKEGLWLARLIQGLRTGLVSWELTLST